MRRTRSQTQAEREPEGPTLTAEQPPGKVEQPSRKVARKRKRKRTETKAKKPKLTDDEYVANCARGIESRQKNEPIRLSKFYFDKAVRKIRDHKSKERKKRKHPLIEHHGAGGAKALSTCHSFSIETLNRSLVQPVNYAPTLNLLTKTLRRALLARNWSYCLRLCDAYLQHGTLRRRHLLYLFKLIFFLMLNSNVSSERLNKFLTITLSMRNPEKQEAYLWSLMDLKEFSGVLAKRKTLEKDDASSEEDDPNDILLDEQTVALDDDATSDNADKSDSS